MSEGPFQRAVREGIEAAVVEMDALLEAEWERVLWGPGGVRAPGVLSGLASVVGLGAVAEEGSADDERADDEGDGESLVGLGDSVDGDDGAEDVGEDQDRGHGGEGTGVAQS